MKSSEIADFASLSPTDFEFSCRALLRELGFQNIQWRTGGRDRGRDIVAEFVSEEPDRRKVVQTWFVECKHHGKSNPVGVDDLQAKIAWADAEQPDYFLVITSSHLSPDAKDWFDRIAPGKRYKLRYWEDSTLLDLLDRFPILSAIYLHERVSINGIEASRVHSQLKACQNELAGNDAIMLEEVLGDPPDRILFRFRCPAIAAFDSGNMPIITNEHKILYSFKDYQSPQQLPSIHVVTPIIHPHVYPSGLMCYGYCDPLISLSSFIRHVYSVISGDQICLQSAVNRDKRLVDYLRTTRATV